VGEDGGQSRVAVYQPDREYVVHNDVFGQAPLGSDYLAQDGKLLLTFTPFEGFRGGTRVAVADVTGDGIDDIIVAAGPGGGAHVKIYGGSQMLTGRAVVVADFFAFDASFRGGVYVAVGQMNPLTEQQEIIVGAGEGGGPHVRIFAMDHILFAITPGTPTPELYWPRLENEFYAFDAGFRGGVRVAAGDVTGDGRAELIAAAGPGGGPHVRVFDVNHPDPLALYTYSRRVVDEFYAYDAKFRGGVYVAAGQLTGDAAAEIVTGPGEGGGPHVKMFAKDAAGKLKMSAEAFVGSPALTSGVHVGIADLGYGVGTGGTTGRPSFAYFGVGYDPAAIQFSPQVGGFNFQTGFFARTVVTLPGLFENANGRPHNLGL
jgi:hypothetical protein